MMRSLYSAVSGLKSHQTKMDVIGNNIANVNTVGFKASKVTFSDVFYQTTQNATGANALTGAGGTNAKQIGLGTTIGAISTDVTSEGSAERTDNIYDMMVSGDCFFIVRSGGTNYFTKVGSFTEDGAGNLVTQSGQNVMGWQVDANTGEIVQDIVSPIVISSPSNKNTPPEPTTNCYLSGNIDKTNSSFDLGYDGVTQTGIPLTYTIYDNLGYTYTVKMNITQDKTDASGATYDVTLSDIVDSSGKSILYLTDDDGIYLPDANGDKQPITGASAVFNDNGTDATSVKLRFDATSGEFVSVGEATNPVVGALNLSIDNGSGVNPFTRAIEVDFANTTLYSSTGKTTINMTTGSTEGLGKGKKVGTMTGVSIGTDGKITLKYDNGDTRLIGQIAVATFSNASGLEKIGDSLYQTTMNSGDFDGIGQDPTATGGKLSSGTLEMSNVDLASEFTSMITTQRGYQANSRIITTSDSLLEELVNLKR